MRTVLNKVATAALLAVAIAICAAETAGVYAADAAISTPQTTYSVSDTAKAFNLNAKCANSLTYTSSKPNVASVAPTGTITPRSIGSTVVTIIDRTNKNNRKSVTIKVSKYKKPNGLVAESMYNADGKSGDRYNIESMVHKYQYNKKVDYMSYNFIIRCTDPVVADKAAYAANYIVNNKNFGYTTRAPSSQANINARASIYKACLKATGKNPSYAQLKKIRSIKTKADTSCTPTLLAGYWLHYDVNYPPTEVSGLVTIR